MLTVFFNPLKVEVSSKNYTEVFTVLNKYEQEFMFEQICNLLNTTCIQSITQVYTKGV